MKLWKNLHIIVSLSFFRGFISIDLGGAGLLYSMEFFLAVNGESSSLVFTTNSVVILEFAISKAKLLFDAASDEVFL